MTTINRPEEINNYWSHFPGPVKFGELSRFSAQIRGTEIERLLEESPGQYPKGSDEVEITVISELPAEAQARIMTLGHIATLIPREKRVKITAA